MDANAASKQHGVVFSLLTHEAEVPRSPRSAEGEGAASLQRRSEGNATHKS